MRRDAIIAAVTAREEAMQAFLRHIVDMDSPTEDKRLSDAVGAVLEAKAQSLGMHVTRDPQAYFGDNLVCRAIPTHKSNAPRVLLVGHFDTVYAAGTVAERPYRLDGDHAYGCGIYDMKGGLTIGLFALEALASVRGEIPLPVTFIFNSDEEIGSPKSRRVIEEEAARHDLALILEPGRPGPALTIARKGVGIFRLTVDGREAHAGAEPEKGINAIVEIAHKTLAIQALNAPDLGTTVTPGVITGGTKPYVVPGQASLEVDCRVPSEDEQNRILRAMDAISASISVPGTSTRLSGGFHRSPMEPTARAMAYVRQLQAIADAVGYPIGAEPAGGASDGNLTSAIGTPTIDGLGPHGGRAHSPEEFIELGSLPAKCRLLACFLDELAG
ncbi:MULTISPECIES: M20 family metallopeptidase [unclassified Chelatococcus]|uniref:M20 family metallopeptidase n=1 Tax=unclassified Chelatococcus TaxID=2638111 RepID=UPI001BCD5A5F|nr:MULTISPECIES: M20 family metallopeptidase [unclassified Chelatococcus]MBS7699862.1 M20 family metallopeptidase [Chelatococcus sp. YT9]MBX3558792.1 M20 family metallopeptidase [Chelatococcus sp.]